MEPETPTKPVRLRKFAIFFKGYMGVSSIVTAALPIPVTAFRLLPVLGVHRKVLSVYPPLFCFLILAFIFYNRHALAKYMFPFHIHTSKQSTRKFRPNLALMTKFAPGVLIILTLMSIVGYQMTIDRITIKAEQEIITNNEAIQEMITKKEAIFEFISRDAAGSEFISLDATGTSKPITPEVIKLCIRDYLSELGSVEEIENTPDYTLILMDYYLPDVFESATIIGLYVCIFIFAESAFIIMALKEYMQDVIGISDREMLGVEKRGHKPPPPEATKS